MYHLIDLLEVSRGTVQNDLNKLREIIKCENLNISYSRKDGYQIIGDEKNIQYFMMKLIVEMVTHDNLIDKYGKLAADCLNNIDQLKHNITESLLESNKTISENNLNIISYIYIFYRKRNSSIQNKFIKESLIDLKEFEEYEISKRILEKSDTEKEYYSFLASLLLSYVSSKPY